MTVQQERVLPAEGQGSISWRTHRHKFERLTSPTGSNRPASTVHWAGASLRFDDHEFKIKTGDVAIDCSTRTAMLFGRTSRLPVASPLGISVYNVDHLAGRCGLPCSRACARRPPSP